MSDTDRLEPIVDWIGNWPVSHGERGSDIDPVNPKACLCGEPFYYQCHEYVFGGGGIETLTIHPDGHVDDGWVDPMGEP